MDTSQNKRTQNTTHRTLGRITATFLGLTAFLSGNILATGQTVDWAVGDGDWDTSSLNWTNLTDMTLTNFTDYTDSVRFSDVSSGSSPVTITLPGYVTPAAMTNDSTKDYVIQGPGQIVGSGPFYKANSGKLTLLITNASTGAIAIDGGTVQLGDGTTDGALAGDMAIHNNATLIFNTANPQTYAGVISGDGTSLNIEKTGPGTLMLTGNNSYGTGVFTVSQGTLQVGDPADGSSGQISGSSTSSWVQNDANIAYYRTSNLNLNQMYFGSGSLTLESSALFGASAQYTINYDQSYFYGPLKIDGCRLRITTLNSLSASPEITVTNWGQILFANAAQVGTWTNNFILSGLGQNETVPYGTLRVGGSTGGTVFSGNIYLAGDARFGALNDLTTISGVISGPGGFELFANNGTNPRKLVLQNANTYSGDTTIRSQNRTSIPGTSLVLDTGGTIDNSPRIIMAYKATLDVSAKASGFSILGTQTLVNNATVDATQADRGTNYIVCAAGQALTLDTGAQLQIEATNDAPYSVPLIIVTGDLALNNNDVTVNVNGTEGLLAGDYPLMQCTGTLSGSANATVTMTGAYTPNASIVTTAGAAGTVVLHVEAPPGPVLTSVTPDPVVGSSFPVTLNLDGSGFVSGCTVLLTNQSTLAGYSYAATFNSSTSLSVDAVLGTGAATWDVTVVNPDLGSSAQATFTVTVPSAPSITEVVSPDPTNLILSGTGGTAGYSYVLLGSTDVTLSRSLWTPIATNTFDGSGNFSCTNAVDPATPKYFLTIGN